MITITTKQELVAASTADLVAYYNHHADKPVKRFSDRQTAERRVLKLIEENRGPLPNDNGLSQEATELLAALEADAGNWSGCPLWEGNVGDDAQRPYLNELIAAGLVHLQVDHENGETQEWVIFGKGETKAPTSTTASQGIADSWTDPDVRAARSSRIHIMVDGTTYKSVRQAFVALDLPLNQHIAFRGRLRDEKAITEYGHDWVVTEIVPPKK